MKSKCGLIAFIWLIIPFLETGETGKRKMIHESGEKIAFDPHDNGRARDEARRRHTHIAPDAN